MVDRITSHDASTLYVQYNRYYSVEVGKFISRDPIGHDGGKENLYRYGVNSPTLTTDASGLAEPPRTGMEQANFIGEQHLSLGEFVAGVEDDRAQGEAFAGSGTPCYLLEHPWNLMQDEVEGVSRVADWHELVQHLLKLRDKR